MVVAKDWFWVNNPIVMVTIDHPASSLRSGVVETLEGANSKNTMN